VRHNTRPGGWLSPPVLSLLVLGAAAAALSALFFAWLLVWFVLLPRWVDYRLTVAGFLITTLVLLSPLTRRKRQDEIRRKRQAHGLCPECGYDLRATPGRCPEMFSLLQSADSSFFAPWDAPRLLRGY
jgi:hypothetical protein